MLVLWGNDVAGVDTVEAEVGIPVIDGGTCPVQTFVTGVGDNIALVFPDVGSRVRRFHHADERTLRPRVVEVSGVVGGSRLDVVVHHHAVIHAVEAVLHLTCTRSPVAIGGILDFSQSHTSADGIQRVLNPQRCRTHGAAQVLPVNQVLRAASVEVTAGLMSIAVAGIRLVHVVVAVVGLHHRWVMHVSQVPLRAVAPARNAGIVVIVVWSQPVGQYLLGGTLQRGEGSRLRVDHVFRAVGIGPDIVGRTCFQTGKHSVVAASLNHVVVDGGFVSGSIAEAPLQHTDTASGEGCRHSSL